MGTVGIHRSTCAADFASHEIYRCAGRSDARHVGMGRLAIALLGKGCLDYDAAPDAAPVRIVRDPWRFVVREGMADPAVTMAVARGLATWWLAGEIAPHAPQFLVDLTAHVALPPTALRLAVARYGTDPGVLAPHFVCPVWVAEIQLRRLLLPLRRCAQNRQASVARAWTPKIFAGGR